MTSNEHGAIEHNVEHHETNNLTYYTRERSYMQEVIASGTGETLTAIPHKIVMFSFGIVSSKFIRNCFISSSKNEQSSLCDRISL